VAATQNKQNHILSPAPLRTAELGHSPPRQREAALSVELEAGQGSPRNPKRLATEYDRTTLSALHPGENPDLPSITIPAPIIRNAGLRTAHTLALSSGFDANDSFSPKGNGPSITAINFGQATGGGEAAATLSSFGAATLG
jgi:hypothetical protein